MHDQNPKVSVVIPTYNRSHLIARAIQSVLDQTYQDLEIIIVDDGSTDSTEEIVKSFKNDNIIYIQHNINKGPSAARNTGIKASKGEYIAFQDSDDEWLPEKLEKQIDVFCNSPLEVGVVYTSIIRIENDKKIYIPRDCFTLKEGKIHDELLKENFVGTPAVLIKKECFEKTKYFDENLPALEDWELWIEISKYYDFRYINKPLIYSYYTPNSINTNQDNTLKALKIILANHLEDFNHNKKVLSKHYLFIGVNLCSSGDFKNGRNYIIKAMKAHFLNNKAMLFFCISLFGQNTYFKFRDIYRKLT